MPDPLDELFTATPQEFVARRNELAKALRKDKRRDEAAEVAALRRPTAPLWALNQLARRHPDDVAELLDAGADLPAAQEALLGGDQDRFRAAVARHRDLLNRMARLGAQLVADAGVSPTDQRQDIATELQAASTIPDAAEPFRQGRLADHPSELGDPDTGLLGRLTAAPPSPADRPSTSRSGRPDRPKRPAASGPADDDEAERGRAEREQAERERAERERAEREQERAAAEVAVAEAEEAARQAKEEHRALAGEVADLEADLERARRRLQAAAERRSEAEDALAVAERALRALR